MNSKSNSTINSNIIAKVISSELFWIISFSILTAIAAQISIPVKPVPFTLQTLMVGLTGAFLGARNGAYSQFLYLFLGVIGLPVFAPVPDGYAGFASLFGPTGGYLLAFPAAAFIAGYIMEKNKSYISIVSAMVITEFVIILSGIVYLNVMFLHNWIDALKSGAIIFSLWTVIKIFAGASIYMGLNKTRKK
ncbi:MAG TPA: biotin transporter BioY [Ignavibacteriaceae bacterium]|nr:biotin transporter BioY [Ignavibacteriaceae bacterium]